MQIADIGDVVANLYNVEVACDNITSQYEYVKKGKHKFDHNCETKSMWKQELLYVVSKKHRLSKFQKHFKIISNFY